MPATGPRMTRNRTYYSSDTVPANGTVSQSRSPALPEDLESPDVGFVSVAGVYVAVASVAAAVAGTLAVDGSTAAVVGSISSAATVGLVVGALLASRVDGLAERLGRRPRSLALPFAAPATFALATPVVLTVPAIPNRTGLGTGLGTLGTFVVALGVAAMARTRYARAVTPDEPLLTIPRLHPDHVRRSIGCGIACVAVGVALPFGGLLRDDAWIAGEEWLLRSVGTVLFAIGLAFVLVGMSYRTQFTERETGVRSHPVLPDRTRRRVYGTDWSWSPGAETDYSSLPELRVYETGLIATGALGDRFVPWTDVRGVRLTPTELVVERRGRFDIRCDRSVIDDPESIAERIDRWRESPGVESSTGSAPVNG